MPTSSREDFVNGLVNHEDEEWYPAIEPDDPERGA